MAQIIHVRDKEKLHEDFFLTRPSYIRIYAIGEGDRSEMYDYGWIENDRGRTIWEMTYRKSERAGGAKKNLLFNDVILLDRGEYTVFYSTDGSHSYRDWNATPPDDSHHYGITIIKQKSK